MWIVNTIFDKAVRAPKCPRPVVSVVCNSKTAKIYTLDLFRKGSGVDLLTVKNKLRVFLKILQGTDEVIINDLKSHIDALSAFGMEINIDGAANIYSRPYKILYDSENSYEVLISKCKSALKDVLLSQDKKPIWQLLSAKASLIYSGIQKRGFYDGIKTNYPQYSIESFSGRPTATGYTIFNQSSDAFILPHDRSHTKFIQFDWIAADFRAGCLLSQDKKMVEAFQESDPYTILATHLNRDRSECKKLLLIGTNSLNPNSEALSYYDGFRDWILASIDELRSKRYLESLLGRRYYYNDTDDQYEQDKRIINAVLQGTVVHAMQNVLWTIYRNFGNHFLTDRFDSIIMTADESTTDFIIDNVSAIMLKPFSNLPLPENIRTATFPISISAGPRWGSYTYVKEVR